MPDPPENPYKTPANQEPALVQGDFSQHPPHSPNPIFFGSDGLRAGWALLLYALLYELLRLLAVTMATAIYSPPVGARPDDPMRPGWIMLTEGSVAAAVAVATWVMSKIEGRRFGDYGLSARRWAARMAAGFAWGLALLSALVLILKLLGLLVVDGRLLYAGAVWRFGIEWLLAFFLVGLYEETFFRGNVQFTLSRGLSTLFRLAGARHAKALGFWTSAVLLSFGFGLSHLENSGESRIGILAAGFIGVAFCLSLWRTGSLWWAIGFHAAWDWAESFLYGAYDSGGLIQGRLLATHPHGSTWLSGGTTGPEGSIFVLPILAGMAGAILLTLHPGTGCSERAARMHLDLP